MRVTKMTVVAMMILSMGVAGVQSASASSAVVPAPVTPTTTEIPLELISAARLAPAEPPSVQRAVPDVTSAAPVPTMPSVAPSVPEPIVIEHEVDGSFSAVGFRYQPTDAAPGIEVKVRENGVWSEWEPVAEPDGGPDEDSAEGRRAAAHSARVTTEPLLTSRADAFTVRVTPTDGQVPEGFGALVIDPGTSAADAQVGATAQAAAPAPSVDFPYPAPKIISRAGWGADENLRTSDPECVTPDYDNTIKIGFVHHTASTNNYTATTAFEQLRAIYAYHIQGFGWCDFGYNFLVDKYGRIFEGRWGGVDRPVHGAHTGGFNTDTFAVSALGNYEEVGAPDGMVNSIAQVLGWKLGMYARDVYGRDTLVSAGGGTSKYPAGVSVTFNVISGHRDPGNTLCPGQFLYDRLPQIRQIAAGVAQQTYTGITAVNPVNQRKSYAGSAASISAFIPASTYYEFTVTELCTGRTVRRFIGFTERGTLQLGWDLRDDSGQYVRGGNYSWRLAATNGGQATGQVEVVPPTERAAGATTASGISAAGFIPITPVRVSDSRNGNAQPLAAASTRNIKVVGAGQVPATGVQGVALNVTSVCATEQTFFTAWAAGSPQPFTSSLNVGPGDVVPGLVVAPVGADGSVTVYNSNGSSHLVVDVVGYFPATGGNTLRSTTPVRVLDGWATPMSGGQSKTLSLAQSLGVQPSALAGVVANVTIAGASAPGYVELSPGTQPSTGTSSANARVGGVAANRVFTGAENGQLTVRYQGGTAAVIVDVVGYFTGQGSGARYTSVTPTRIVDSRTGTAVAGPLGANSTTNVPVTGVGPIPGSAASVMATLTSVDATQTTYFTAWAAGQPRPYTSDLNPSVGAPRANAAVLWPGTGRASSIYNAAGTSGVIVDVTGYFG